MEYVSTKEMATKWGISQTRVFMLAREGKIEGSIQVGSRWLIPKAAEKPKDGRLKQQINNSISQDNFRYFMFDFKKPNEFYPPLSKDETLIQKACNLFHLCEFEKSEKILLSIDFDKANIYNRIFILFCKCMVFILLGKIYEFKISYENLNVELQKNFPRKKELSILPYEINGILGATSYFINDFKIDSNYSYHTSFLPHLTYLSIISLVFSKSTFSEKDLIAYEIASAYVDKTTYYADSQTIHCYLGIIYGLMNKPNDMRLHIEKSLQLGIDYNLFWLPSLVLFYYKQMMEPILKNFSIYFYNKITFLSKDINKRFNLFMTKISHNNFYTILLSNDYIYVFYAIQGYTNKQVADILSTSESYVNNKYSKIYQRLNISNKKELKYLYIKFNSNSIFETN